MNNAPFTHWPLETLYEFQTVSAMAQEAGVFLPYP